MGYVTTIPRWAKNLTERRFRAYWEQTSGNKETRRFRAVWKMLLGMPREVVRDWLRSNGQSAKTSSRSIPTVYDSKVKIPVQARPQVLDRIAGQRRS